MIKKLLLTYIVICVAVNMAAQKHANEWINYNQKYFKISIVKTGLYRIDSLALANSGIPVSTINPKNFQLFIKGQEQHIYIKGENDNIFNANDYLEFYAEKNDCHFDSIAYHSITRLPNPYIPLFNDTNYAFITWNSVVTNKRVNFAIDVNFTNYTPANYVYSERVASFANNYSQGNILFSTISDPRYIAGEGYGTIINQGASVSTNFPLFNVYQSPNLPVHIKASFSGTSQNYSNIGFDHQLALEYLNTNNSYSVLNDTLFSAYNQVLVEKTIPSSNLANNAILKLTSLNNSAFSAFTNKTNVHYLYLKYPQTTDFFNATEQTFYVDDNALNSKTYLTIQNVNVGAASVVLYDLTNHTYVLTSVTGNTVKALIPNSLSQKKCYLTTSANINTVTHLNPVSNSGFFQNLKITTPDSAYIIITHKGLLNAANSYKTYRQSIVGGSNSVILATVEELYDQFAYGNLKNPLAIKNFCSYLSDSLTVPPKYVLLIGKSVKNELIRAGGVNWDLCELPSMGIPASDNLLTCGIHGANSLTPFIPIGRISAKTEVQVINYLNKVKAHEASLPNHEEWRKHVLHFAGGIDANQQQQFQSFLQSYENSIEDTLFGGKVYNFRKTSTAPIQITISDSVKQLIDYGASIITFFGHGSATGFDQAIDDPSLYNNKDKYPFFIANSCYSGDIHNPSTVSTSENFTLIDEKGSIGFLASSSTGVIYPLNYYSSALYKSLAYETYYKGIGDAVKNACFKNSTSSDVLLQITCLDMTLQGDPSIKLNGYAKPDYEIKNSSVSLDAISLVDSVGINITIKNLGKAIIDTFIVSVQRYFPSGDSISFNKKIKAPYNQTSLSFNLFKDFERGVGLNKFKVVIDAYNEIDELSENNNATIGTVDVFISGGDVVPVYPYNYAIIPKTNQVTLKASTADPFAIVANYILELDTNDTFTNPLQTTRITSGGGVVEWTVNLPLPDSTVYFWRISKDSILITDHFSWKESSFQVIENKSGWAQAHFQQFKNDAYQFVKFNRLNRRFDFQNDIKSLKCNNGLIPYVAFDQINYQVNGSLEDYWTCSPNGWSFAVFDSISAKAWEQYTPVALSPGTYGNCLCVNYTLKSFAFGSSSYCSPTPWQANIETFLNSIPPNSKILAWSQSNHQSQSFSNSLYTAFESFGAANIRTVKDTVPYIIFGKKGAAIGTAHEEVGQTKMSILHLSDTLKTKWNNGFIASEIIGPSTKWNSLHWKQLPRELPNTDSISLKVVGIKENGQRDTLVTFPKDSIDVYDLARYANATTHPYLQLVAMMADNVSITPPQLKKWQVLYDQVPECAINPKKGFAINNDTLQEGDQLIVKLPIENIGNLPFTDSLLITYWLEDKNKVITLLPSKLKAKPFNPTQVIMDTVVINTINYIGQNYVWVDVNTTGNAKSQDEQYHFNNVARVPFFVSTDNMNPLLDVTFDGTHILNGEIVSAKPHVLISLKDENKFLALNDTANFNVFVKYPNQATEKRIYFLNNLQFTPAHLPSNSCKIEWFPEFFTDGKYTLIVQATDRSKNESGAQNYQLQFEIVNKQTITEVMNYPNPFSTSTRFIFSLTGAELPDVFTIQILTITGKVVREITKQELGNIHIGKNITDYAWDGRDEFGDKLGNGVYLYKVITRYNGQAIEKKQTEADSFFKNGIGKLVIMR